MGKSHSKAASPLSDSDHEVFKQVGIGLRGTFAKGATTNRPVHDLDAIQRHLGQLGHRQFTSREKGARLDLEAKVHFASNLARTDVSAIILSIKRQSTALAILSILGKILSGFKKNNSGGKTKTKKGDIFLRLTPNGYQTAQSAEALNRRTPVHEYTPETADPIGQITTEFLTHLRRTLDAER